MTVITIVSAPLCSGDEVAEQVRLELGYSSLTTDQLVDETAERSGILADRVRRTLSGQQSIFDRFTHERERQLAHLRLTLALLVESDDVVHHGMFGYLLTRRLTHVLRVGLAAPPEVLIQRGVHDHGSSEREARSRVKDADEALRRWTLALGGLGPWDKSHFDVFLPMDATTLQRAVELVVEGARNPALRTTAVVRQALRDEVLAARVAVALADEGKGADVDVEADGGVVTLVINRYVMWLERFERELVKIAAVVSDVAEVRTRVGPHFRRPNTYPGLEADVPRKILLVDDEAEFVETLSERLLTRNLETAVAYDGEQALAIAEQDAPDVMVVDMNMPGMDGMEVLRTIRQRHPHTEVIVLTAHGSDEMKQTALKLGAFAYLRKPADIDELAGLMQAAYRKARAGAGDLQPENPAEEGEDDRAGDGNDRT